MATPEQLLESGRIATMGYLGMIDASLTRSLQFQKSVSDSEVNTVFKVAGFMEDRRMNDAKITQINNENEIRRREFDIREMMAPMQLETQRLQLETQRVGLLRQKQQTDLGLFNEITKPYDTSMASRFASVQSPEYMRGYLDMKGKYLSNISQGNPFDSTAFEKDLNDLNDQYADLKPSTDPQTWNPEVSHMLGIIDPNTQRIYEQRNPTYSKNANALAVSYVTSPDNQVASIAEKYGGLFSDEKLAQVSINRDVYQTNKSRMDSISNQISRLSSALPLAKNDEARAQINDQYNTLLNQFTELENQNTVIIRNLTQGNYSSISEPVTATPAVENRPDPKQWTERKEPVIGVANTEGLTSTFKQNVSEVASIFEDKEFAKLNPGNPLANTELRNVDLSWFENNLKSGEADSASTNRIKVRIEDGIESTGVEGFGKTRADKLFSTIKQPSDVAVSSWLGKTIYQNMPHADSLMIFGTTEILASKSNSNTDKAPYTINFGNTSDFASGDGNFGISSYEAIEEILRSIPNKAARAEAKKELYAALTTAAIKSAISKR